MGLIYLWVSILLSYSLASFWHVLYAFLQQLREIQSGQQVSADQTGKESVGKADQQHGSLKSTMTEKKRRKVIVEEVSEPSASATSTKGKRESPEREEDSASKPDHRDRVQHVDLSQVPQEKV